MCFLNIFNQIYEDQEMATKYKQHRITLTKAEALAFYNGSARELAQALGVSTQRIYQIADVMPRGLAYELQSITRGGLIASYEEE